MKQDNELEIPVGVSLTHDKGYPILFAYVGGGRGRLGMKAKRFNPRVLGGLERALKQAIRWRKQALKEHTAAVAALPARAKRKATAAARPARAKRKATAVAARPARAKRKAAKTGRKGGKTRNA